MPACCLAVFLPLCMVNKRWNYIRGYSGKLEMVWFGSCLPVAVKVGPCGSDRKKTFKIPTQTTQLSVTYHCLVCMKANNKTIQYYLKFRYFWVVTCILLTVSAPDFEQIRGEGTLSAINCSWVWRSRASCGTSNLMVTLLSVQHTITFVRIFDCRSRVFSSTAFQ